MFQNFNTNNQSKYSYDRVKSLRSLLKKKNLDGVIVPKVDRYQGEYIPLEEERLSWLTNFSGSAGMAIVSQNAAAIFVDGRYRLQAQKEVDTSIFSIKSLPQTSLVTWLKENVGISKRIAFDPWLTTTQQVKNFSQECEKQITFVSRANLIDKLWRRERSAEQKKAFLHEKKFCGELFQSKLKRVQEELAINGLDNYFFCKPDAVCWLLNIRGYDVPHNPIVNCFALLKHNKEIVIFSENPSKFSEIPNNKQFKKILFTEFSQMKKFISSCEGNIGFDHNHTPWKLYQLFKTCKKEILSFHDPANQLKSIKNIVEIDGMKSAHVHDATAFIKFLYWFFKKSATTALDEISLIKNLESFRHGTGHLQEISFDTICGSGPNGSIIHYRATTSSNRKIKRDEIILIDSGGQYFEGTTDITRSICRGQCDKRIKKLYTLVLKGLISLSSQIWPRGLTGQDLDPLARIFLWKDLKDYAHGTGHGVGAFLCVHEGPIGIHKMSKAELKPGMILSIEPGYYEKNKLGIRLENLVVVNEVVTGNGKGFLKFDALTLVPFQKNMIDFSIMGKSDISWLNSYHRSIVKTIGARLSKDEAAWLETQCAPVVYK